jgi:hypothetical protein
MASGTVALSDVDPGLAMLVFDLVLMFNPFSINYLFLPMYW